MLVLRARLLISTLWVGSLWTVGYMVAPTLFITLSDRVLAGSIAGNVFRVEAWLSIFCAVTLMVLQKLQAYGRNVTQRRFLLILICAMLVCTLISHFGLQPFMAALREQAGASGVMAPNAKVQFGILHGLSSALYFTQSLMGVVLVLKIRETDC